LQIEEIRRITLELIYKVRDALVATSSEFHKITSDLKECFGQVLEKAREQVREVIDEVKDCIEHGPQTTTVEPTTVEPTTVEPTTDLPEAPELY
jgi:selenocysteine lyase/cysteine desulfurase